MLQPHLLVLAVFLGHCTASVDCRLPIAPYTQAFAEGDRHKWIPKAGSFPFLSKSVPFGLIAEYEAEPMTKFSKYKANKKSTDDGVQKDLTHIFGGGKTFPCTPTPPQSPKIERKTQHRDASALQAQTLSLSLSLYQAGSIPPYFTSIFGEAYSYKNTSSSTSPRPSLFG